MAVKLEVIIYTDENGRVHVRNKGFLSNRGFTDKEVGVRQH